MKQKYYVDNLMSRFIKCLLWDTYLPIVSIWKPNTPIIKGLTYVTFDRNIVRAKLDYTPNSENRGPQTSLNSTYFEKLDDYVVGKFYRGITTNFRSNSALYDSSTHYYLGQYLRAYRDIFGVDLMPFYNCYSGNASTKIRIKMNTTLDANGNVDSMSEKLIDNNTIDDGLITYIVPIKFNQYYTIYFNSQVPFRIKPAYYDGISLSDVKNVNGQIVRSDLVGYCSAIQPHVYKPLTYAGNQEAGNVATKLKEEYLVLLIQVPKKINSALTVLEGDYSNTKINNNPFLDDRGNIVRISKLTNHYIGNIKELSKEDVESIFKPVSSLPHNVDRITYAFNNRLIEYLLYAPIVVNDRIKDNIKRVQENITSSNAKKVFGEIYKCNYVKDVWDNQLRYYLYNLVTQGVERVLKYDVNGFVDKDSEFIIDRGKVLGGDFDV